MARTCALLLLLLDTSSAGRAANTTTTANASSFFVWHITDVHVDPWYVEGADAAACYCETTASCPRIGAHCGTSNTSNTSTAARPWGSSEGNCATPTRLYDSAVAFMARTKATPLVYFTGDFAEAGASAACDPAAPAAPSAQRQILDIMTYDWRVLKAALPLPATRAFGSLGNHDSAPGDVFYGMNDEPAPGGGRQSWQYENLTALWAADLGLPADAAAEATLRRGGYYAVAGAAPGLTVISLNVNYWVLQNPEAAKPNSTAAREGARMMAWLGDELRAAAARGDAVHVLGHQPPAAGGAPLWLPGYWGQFTALCNAYRDTIRGHFFGHIHIDQWTLTRACDGGGGGGGGGGRPWKETGGIKWCSGGGDFASGDSFGAGVDGYCPLLPRGWDTAAAVAGCTGVCNATNASACVGFTLYFEDGRLDGSPNSTVPRACCFRTISTASKPPDADSSARCYEKPAPVCSGAATTVVLPGPSLTEGFPATNPSLRLLEFDARSYALLDAHTYTADLHAANADHGNGGAAPSLDWELEYSFREAFSVPDMSAAALEALGARLAVGGAGDTVWAKFRGMGDGCYWAGGYTAQTAPFPPKSPPTTCDGACRASFVDELNATALSP
jgi:hypothetical protein